MSGCAQETSIQREREYRVEPSDDLRCDWGEGGGWRLLDGFLVGVGAWTVLTLPSFNLGEKCRNGQAPNHFTRRFC